MSADWRRQLLLMECDECDDYSIKSNTEKKILQRKKEKKYTV